MSAQSKTALDGLGADALAVLQKRAESLAGEVADQVQTRVIPLVIFRLCDEWYAVRVEEVKEIGGAYTITPLPGVPSFIRGVINIRGEIVSVTDLALLMNVSAARPESSGGEASTIVVATDQCVSALLVDAVSDIVEVPAENIEPPVAAGERGQESWVNGSVFHNGQMISLIDLENVLKPIGENQ